jgi:hypothetical protein
MTVLQLAEPTTVTMIGKEPVPSRDVAVALTRARLKDWLHFKLINKDAYIKLGILLFLAERAKKQHLTIDMLQLLVSLDTEITKITAKDVKLALVKLEMTEGLDFGGLTFESSSVHTIENMHLQLDLFSPNQQEVNDD